MQISPGEIYAIRRQLDDPLDVSTWYVRAVLYWADTDVVIPINGQNYVNLTDRGSQLFRENITVPPDKNGGSGSRIAIKTTVYSDSGYTTVSDTYGIKEVELLVFDRRNPFMGMGGGGVNYDLIRKHMADAISNRTPKGMFDPQPIVDAINGLRSDIASIRIPEQEKVEFGEVLSRIDDNGLKLQKAIQGIHIPEQVPTDLTPVTSRIDKLMKILDPEMYQQKMEDILTRLKSFFGHDMDEIRASIKTIADSFAGWRDNLKKLVVDGIDTAKDTTNNDEPL